MILTLEWLCAILAPREMAAHPNFFNDEDLTAAGALAATANFDEQTWRRVYGDARLASSVTDAELHHLEVIRDMSPFDGQSPTENARMLSSSLPVDRAVPIALLTVVALAAAECHEDALGLLQILVRRLEKELGLKKRTCS